MDQLQLLSLGGNMFSGGLPTVWGSPAAFPLLVSMDLNGSSLTGDCRIWTCRLCIVTPLTAQWMPSASDHRCSRRTGAVRSQNQQHFGAVCCRLAAADVGRAGRVPSAAEAGAGRQSAQRPSAAEVGALTLLRLWLGCMWRFHCSAQHAPLAAHPEAETLLLSRV